MAMAAAVVLGLLLSGCGPEPAELPWFHDLPSALAEAKKTGHPILMEFTGSDWCPPCKELRKEVLQTKEFADFSATRLVLLELDFPRSKSQSPDVVKANQALLEKFKVEGFPTLVFLKPDGTEFARNLGPGASTPAEFIQLLNGFGIR